MFAEEDVGGRGMMEQGGEGEGGSEGGREEG